MEKNKILKKVFSFFSHSEEWEKSIGTNNREKYSKNYGVKKFFFRKNVEEIQEKMDELLNKQRKRIEKK